MNMMWSTKRVYVSPNVKRPAGRLGTCSQCAQWPQRPKDHTTPVDYQMKIKRTNSIARRQLAMRRPNGAHGGATENCFRYVMSRSLGLRQAAVKEPILPVEVEKRPDMAVLKVLDVDRMADWRRRRERREETGGFLFAKTAAIADVRQSRATVP